MILTVLSHIRSHFVVCVALFFASAGSSFADSELAIRGRARIISNRIVVSPPVTALTPGPTVLQTPGFGDLFVAECDSGVASLMFVNTSDVDIDFFVGAIVEVLAPGEGIQNPASAVFLIPTQLGSGTGKDRKVATVTVSGLFDFATTPNECRFNAQAITHTQGK